MALDVQIPLGIEVPSAPNETDLARIELAVGDAMQQALTTTLENVLAPRGRARPLYIKRDTMHFDRAISEHYRSQIESAVTRALDYAISASRIESWYDPATVAATSGARVAERFDPSRYRNGRYAIPSYNDKGKKEDVPVDESQLETIEYTGPPLTLSEAVAAAWDAHVKRYGAQWNPATFGYPGYYGDFDVNGTWAENQLVYIVKVEAITEDKKLTEWYVQGMQFAIMTMPEAEVDEEGKPKIPDRFPQSPLPTAMDHYVMTQTELSATAENLIKVQEEAAKNDPSFPHTPEIRKAMAESIADPAQVIYTLEGGEHITHIMLPPVVAGADTVALGTTPIRFIVQSQMELGAATGEGAGMKTQEGGGKKDQGDKSGGAAGGTKEGTGEPWGKGTGKRGGPLGKGTEGEGRLWPTLSGDGEKLVCQAFLGEPPVSQLVVGAKELEFEMRGLAASLDLEYCGYAGQFCINMAKVIGGRAHALGVSSANSSVTTHVTVHPDGSGNNGIVDVRAGEAPEISYLQLLGELVTQIDYLSGRIVDTYSLPANSHLIYWDEDREFDPDWAAWALRFNLAFIDAMESSCMWLFAETCRVVLLQQLRSSNTGITGRQSKFAETNQSFQDALEILGESVVKLSTLGRAISWADRYNLSGSVRSVLSYAPPPRRMRDDYYEIPAPIGSIAPNIITMLETATITEQGDERVANFQGRVWTKKDLEMGVATRRGILNRVDPLFLQVPDLDSLYTQFKASPENAKTYLTNLLAEMLKANIDMTARASKEEKGCFFALEASQYVRSKGGKKANGLEFDLQGVHQLADDLLRSHAQGTPFYSKGVNKAISIKADFDEFLSIFATFGIIALALLCAPLGAAAVAFVTGVAGLALTIHDINEADRLESLYKSLEDPEAILSWQEVQLARLMANLSIAFSIFDVVGVGKGARAIVSAAEAELKAAMKVGAKEAAIGAAKSARKTILQNMTGEVMRNAVKQAMTEAAIVTAMNLILPKVITPIIVPWMRGVSAAHGTLPEVDAVLGPLVLGQPAAPTPISDTSVSEELMEDATGKQAEIQQEPIDAGELP